MKTIEQRLQSRISKRRNFIRFAEEGVADMKDRRHVIRLLDLGFDITGLSRDIRDGKKMIGQLADDQRLDKKLKNIVLERAQLFGLRDL